MKKICLLLICCIALSGCQLHFVSIKGIGAKGVKVPIKYNLATAQGEGLKFFSIIDFFWSFWKGAERPKIAKDFEVTRTKENTYTLKVTEVKDE